MADPPETGARTTFSAIMDRSLPSELPPGRVTCNDVPGLIENRDIDVADPNPLQPLIRPRQLDG